MAMLPTKPILATFDRLLLISMQCVHFEVNAPLEDRLTEAMRYVRSHQDEVFFLHVHVDEDVMFRTAVGAVLLNAEGEDKERITNSLEALRDLSAMLSGVPVDLEGLNAHLDKPNVPLLRLWHRSGRQ